MRVLRVLGNCLGGVMLMTGLLAAPEPLSEVERFNYVLGTQTIGPSYQFTDQPRLLETAQAILDMGSNTIKFALGKDYGGKPNKNVPALNPAIHNLTELVRDEPTHRRVLDMPFAHYLLWTYCFNSGWWTKGFSAADQEKEYRELYDFACYLLRAYNGTGKTFLLGNWEGDWHLRQGYDAKDDSVVKPEAVQGMIDWLNTRQRAISDARRDTPHQDVSVYFYVEVNLVKMALAGRPSVTTSVLPHTDVDYVSYSSYDSGANLKPALDLIESKLKPRPEITGKRVFIGEYGYRALDHGPEKQDAHSRQVMRTALEWGCPYVLYWELYNNEVLPDGRQRGLWLIDDLGVKQPVYYTHQKYYAWGRQYVGDFRAREGRLPTAAEFSRAAVAYLAAP